MIDAVDLVLGQDFEDLRVESLGRCKVVAEGFFDDHPPPCCLGLPGESGAAELLDHRAEEPVGDRQIEQDVARTALPPALLVQQLLEPTVSLSLREVPAHIMHAIDERRPGLLVERLPLAAAGASEA